MRSLSTKFLILILIIAFAIRVWDITLIPPSLYWDEMDAGYQAYSVLKTGRDYFGNMPGFVVQSFADYRTPVFIYSLIPFVGIFGLSSFSVRLPAAIFGTINIFLIYVLGKKFFKSERIGLIAALITTFAPWSIQYSRMAFETTLMQTLFLGGLVCFINGLKNSKFWIASGILFGLTILTYNTAKLFVPLIWICLIVIYIKKTNLNKNFWIGNAIFGLIFLLSFYSSIFQGGGKRFSEISILTDPQLGTKIDYLRSQSALSYTKNREAGQSTRVMDELVYNKLTSVFDKATENYLSAFSPQFLFLYGDPNMRHSPERMGELYRVEAISLILGLGFLLFSIKKGKNSLILLCWIIFAPIPAAITRDGGFHATRLALLFPALSLISATGIYYLWQLLARKISFIVMSLFVLVWIYSIGFFINYYFGAYRIESAKFFQYGFSEAIQKALGKTETQDYVIIDDRRDSALMNYLFDTSYDPAQFQSQIKSLPFKIGGIQSNKLGNMVFLEANTRDWTKIFSKNLIDNNFLLIVSAEQLEEQTVRKVPDKLTENQKLLETIYYQNGDAAFYVIESKKPESN